ncbi:hypothetical protein GCM10027612_25700 [Microbispora bryophytorum subsp. camponoti]
MVAGLRGVAVLADAAQGEADRGGVQLQPGALKRLAHRRLVAVGPPRGGRVVPRLPADEEVAHRLVRRRLLEAAGQQGRGQPQRERGPYGSRPDDPE